MTRNLAPFQEAFARAVIDASADAAPDRLDDEARRRFRVYRNNVQHGLVEALGAAYPSVRRLVGEAFFKGMARAFVLSHPPTSRSLALYGAGFPAFVEAFPPAATVPYLADVARLERARLEAMHSADANPLRPAAVAALGEDVDEARFEAHPATRLVASTHPVVAIWRAQQEEDVVASIAGRPETALVTRPAEHVLVHALDPATGLFVASLLEGQRPTQALKRAHEADPAFDVLRAFQQLLVAGALVAVTPSPCNQEEAAS